MLHTRLVASCLVLGEYSSQFQITTSWQKYDKFSPLCMSVINHEPFVLAGSKDSALIAASHYIKWVS